MATLKIPHGGIHIIHDQPQEKQPRQIIHLDSNSTTTRDILKAIKNNERVNLRLGVKPAIQLGKKSIDLKHGTDEFDRELFSGPLDGSESVYFAGQLSHCLHVLAGAEHALATLRNNVKAAREERASSRDGPTATAFKNDHRSLFAKDRLLPSSTPGSPFVSAGFSPQLAPTSVPFTGALSAKDKLKQEAIKTPLLHLLAIEPQTAKMLATKLRAEQSDCDKLLLRWAQDARSGAGKKELRDRSYKELDVWKFPYKSQADRQAAIDHAVSAFDRQRIDKHDKIWQMLLAKEDRGKNIFLSRLNFDKPIPAGNLTPRIPERSTDGSTEGKSMSSEADDKNRKAKAAQAVSELLGKKKKRPEPEKKSAPSEKGNAKPISSTARDVKASAAPSTKHENKFKSAETITDSDEEVEAANSVVVAASHPQTAHSRKQQTPTPRPAQSVHKSTTHASALASHKAQSSSSSVEIDKKLPASKMAKTRSGADTAKPKAAPPRNDGLTKNPSSLGSSPPANSTDADASSSGKVSSQSSAISSPPSSTELNEVRRNSKFSPSIAGTKVEKHVNGGLKRKADTKHDETAPKRKQVNGVHANGLPKTLGDQVEKAGGFKRSSSDSDTLNSPEKAVKDRQDVVDDAKEFLKCYAKYKDLHETLGRKKVEERTDHDIDRVWKMHKRLEQMKKDIWRDWGLLEQRNGK